MKHDQSAFDSPAPSTRSREHRRAVSMPANILGDNGDISAVDVLDLSYDGVRIQTPVELTPGSFIKFSVVGLGCQDAQVRWFADGQAGLSFKAQSSWDKPHKERSAERLELSAGIQLRRVGRQHYRARIFDISPDGCKVEFVERPRRGELVWVKFDFFDAIEATVCWIDGFYGGVKFLRPIYPSVFELLLAKLDAATGE